MGRERRIRRAVRVGGRFLIVGAVSTAIEIVCFNVLLWLQLDPVWAKVIASLIALVNAYFGNREWTFSNRVRGRRSREIALFVVVNAVCTALGAALVWAGLLLARSVSGAEPSLAVTNVVNLVSIVVVVMVRFGAYHWGVFRSAAPVRPSDRLDG